MFIYRAAKIIGDFLKSLRSNECTIRDTQQFSGIISELLALSEEGDLCLTMYHYTTQSTTSFMKFRTT